MARRPLIGPRTATLLLGAGAIVVATLVVGALHHSPTPSPRAVAAAAARRARAHDPLCHAARCATRTVRTSDLGATFVVVEVLAPGAACHLGAVDFFDGRRLVATSTTLEPFSRGGASDVRARRDGAVLVDYAVAPRPGASCAAALATSRVGLTYALQGGTVLVVAGRPPVAPARVVGSGGR